MKSANVNANATALVLKEALAQKFGDVQWVVRYPDGSYAAGLKMISTFRSDAELYGRAKARSRSQVMQDMGFQIVECGWMKPRNIAKAGPVVVFRIPDSGVVLE